MVDALTRIHSRREERHGDEHPDDGGKGLGDVDGHDRVLAGETGMDEACVEAGDQDGREDQPDDRADDEVAVHVAVALEVERLGQDVGLTYEPEGHDEAAGEHLPGGAEQGARRVHGGHQVRILGRQTVEEGADAVAEEVEPAREDRIP